MTPLLFNASFSFYVLGKNTSFLVSHSIPWGFDASRVYDLLPNYLYQLLHRLPAPPRLLESFPYKSFIENQVVGVCLIFCIYFVVPISSRTSLTPSDHHNCRRFCTISTRWIIGPMTSFSVSGVFASNQSQILNPDFTGSTSVLYLGTTELHSLIFPHRVFQRYVFYTYSSLLTRCRHPSLAPAPLAGMP